MVTHNQEKYFYARTTKNEKQLNLIRFFSPLFPIKIFKSGRLMMFIAIMISLKLVLTMISIKIEPLGLSISISWVPVMILGWHLGLVYGIILGAITDTITFFAFPSGSLWFWMYAIQEPCVGFLAGLFGTYCRFKQQNKFKKNIVDIIVFQVTVVAFVIFSYTILLITTWRSAKQNINDFVMFQDVCKYIALAMLVVFFITCELFFWLWILREKFSTWENKFIFIYATMLVIILMAIFSFALGPFSYVEYLKYKNGREPEYYVKYGAIFYLIPRLVAQCIKVPIESLVLTTAIILSQRYIRQTIMYTNSQWKYNN